MNIVGFFFSLFLTISMFSIFWTVQEGPGRLLGGVFGRSWGVLVVSGGVQEASRERILGALGATFEQSDFGFIF